MEFGKFSFTRKQVIAISVAIILVISSITIFISIQNRIDDAIDQLENSDFVVTKFDIESSTESSLLATGMAEIRGGSREISNNIKVKEFTINLSNNSEPITELTVPLSNDQLSESIEFQIQIPIQNGDPSTLTTDILTYIMIGTNFTLDFTGTISYSYLGVSGKLEFENMLKFELEQEFLEFDLIYIDVFTPGQEPTLNFSLFNPFSIGITLEGDIDIVVNEEIVGYIDLEPTLFTRNWTNLLQSVDLLKSLPELFSVYFENIQEPVILSTSLTMSLGQIEVYVSPDIHLKSDNLGLNFILTAVNSLNVNTFDGTIQVNVNATLQSQLPLALNVSRISGILLLEQTVGTFLWSSDSAEFLVPNIDLPISFIDINSSLSQLDIFSSLFVEFSFSNLVIELFIENQSYTFYISGF